MKFETVDEWPDGSKEFKQLADSVKDGGIAKVPLEGDQTKALNKLRNGMDKFGRYEFTRVNEFAYVRLSTKPQREKKPRAKSTKPAKAKAAKVTEQGVSQ